MEWKTTSKYPDYEISERANIRRISTGVSINVFDNGWGYLVCYVVTENGKRERVRVNRLVALAFYGPPPSSKHQAAHRDGRKTNNHYKNIRWSTPRENMADRKIHGTEIWGENNPLSRLTEKQILEIRKSSWKGTCNLDISKIYGVTKDHIRKIINRDRWKHI